MIRKLIYEIRCALCEVLIAWSMRISPDDYIPSTVEASLNSYRLGKSAVSSSGPIAPEKKP